MTITFRLGFFIESQPETLINIIHDVLHRKQESEQTLP